MTKILLVEDDKSLREIYGVRLFAEGYDVVSAGDGEEALALAIKERPSLIITDVMMPKISGFDMLDILRSTTETKDIKVIVMTALGSEENKDRGERLGADKYLIKSQVGIEDVVHVVHDLLGDQPPAPAAPPAAAATFGIPPMGSPAPASMPQAPQPARPQPVAPTAPAPFPTSTTPPAAAPVASTPGSRPGMISSPALPAPGTPANQQTINPQPMGNQTATPSSASSTQPAARRTRIIEPITDPTKRVDIQALVDKELEKEGGKPIATAADEQKVVDGQLDNFAKRGELPPVNPPQTPASPPTAPPQAPTPPVAQ